MSSTLAESPTHRISPASLTAAALASTGVVVAALAGVRWLTIGLCAGGLLAGLGGLLTFRGRFGSRAASALGGGLSVVILILTLMAPEVLNPFWAAAALPPTTDSEAPIVVSLNNKLEDGTPATDLLANAATQGIRQGDLFVQIQSVKTGQLPDKGTTTYLLINLRIDQMRDGLPHSYERFMRGTREPRVSDSSGRTYPFLGDRVRKSPTKFDRKFVVDRFLVFELPGPVPQVSDGHPMTLELPAAAWGGSGEYRFALTRLDHEPPPDLAKQIAETKAMLRRPAAVPPDRSLGRAVFAKKCQECHTLFGMGGKTGPDLTASKRSDLDFILTSIIDPSAVVEKKYQTTIVVTSTGYVHLGIVQKEDAAAVTILVPSRLVTVPRSEIEEMRPSSLSIMPTELLKDLTEHEVRSLIAYVTGPGQTPLLATPENVPNFFGPTDDLNTWRLVGPRWKVENGVVTPPAAGGRLVSDLVVPGDFSMTLRFNPGSAGRGGVLIGDGPELAGAFRVTLGANSPVEIIGPGGAIVATGSGLTAKADTWNKLEVALAAGKLEVRLNDQVATTAPATGPAVRRTLALDAANDGVAIRYRGFGLKLLGLDH